MEERRYGRLRGLRVVGALAVLCFAGCRTGPEQWGPFHGQVVDAETGRPVAGAYVVVQWYRDPPSLHSATRAYDAQETVTDAEGRFEIPRRSRWFTAWVTAPGLGAFAPGYSPSAEVVSPANGRPYVDPTVLKMRPLKTREEQCTHQPREPWVPYGAAPEMTHAVREYLGGLRCGELQER